MKAGNWLLIAAVGRFGKGQVAHSLGLSPYLLDSFLEGSRELSSDTLLLKVIDLLDSRPEKGTSC